MTLPPPAPKCQFFKVSTSSCLRKVVSTIMSRERGLLNLCRPHVSDQGERDRRLFPLRSVQERVDVGETTIILESND